MALIHRRLIIGQRLGAVPEDSPMAPLQRDLAALQRRLKLPASDGAKTYDFDLRKPTDLGRSQLLHRLNLLDVPWGEPVDAARGAKGTFHEHWRLQWQPEFAVRLIEASHFGSTIEVAASARTIAASQEAGNLRELTELLNDVLLAALPSAVEALVSAIQRRAATGSDVPQLMAALPALARSQRYGNVRQTDQELVASVVAGIIERICIGLPPATTSLNDEAATEMFGLVQGVHSSLQILESPDWFDDWLTSIGQVSNQESSHPLVRGRAVRILYDGGRLGPGELESHLTVATSPGLTRSATAAWFEGFLKDSGLILVHDAVLWNAINSWIGSLGTESFVEVLPLLRRTFATFQAPERRQIGELAKRGGATVASSSQSGQPFDFDRAARVVPLVMTLLGREVADG